MSVPVHNYCYLLCAPPFTGKTATWQLLREYLLTIYPEYKIISHSFEEDEQRDFSDIFLTSEKTFVLLDEANLAYRDEFYQSTFWKPLESYGQMEKLMIPVFC
jgi:hypothetical protein